MATTPFSKYWSVRMFDGEDEVYKFIGENYSSYKVGNYIILYNKTSKEKNVHIEDKYFNGNVAVFREFNGKIESISNKIANGDVLKIRKIFKKLNNY